MRSRGSRHLVVCALITVCFACSHGSQPGPTEPAEHRDDPKTGPSATTGTTESSVDTGATASVTLGTIAPAPSTSVSSPGSVSPNAESTFASNADATGVRLLIVAASGELLGSERRAVDGIVARVRRAEPTVAAEEPSGEEVAFVRSLSEGVLASARPATWKAFRTIAVLYVGPSTELSQGKRLTGGVAGVWVFQAGRPAPVLSLQSETDARPLVDTKAHGDLLASFIERAAKETP